MRRAKIVLAGFIVFLVALVVLADSGRGQPLFALIKQVPAGDKLGHFVLFGILSFLVNLISRGARLKLGRIVVPRGSAIVIGVVTAEEFSQLLFRSRTFDLLDLAADLLGICLCGWLATQYLARKRCGSKATAKTL